MIVKLYLYFCNRTDKIRLTKDRDLKEIAGVAPEATTIQLLAANPLCMTYDKLKPIFEMINKYLPKMD